jgi:hypothetical protein
MWISLKGLMRYVFSVHILCHDYACVLDFVQIAALGENSPLTCLVPDLREISPEDSFSTVPYEKGHTLLFHLEELAGGAGNECLCIFIKNHC